MDAAYIADYHDFGYDAAFDGIRYTPWVGLNYRKQRKPILVVPESVYDWDRGSLISKDSLSQATFVRQCVREIGLHFTMKEPWKGSASKPLYRGIERLIWKMRHVTEQQKLKLWTSIAFHEMVQSPMEDQGARPNREHLRVGAKILRRVIETLKPELCVFLGTAAQKMRALEEEFTTRAERSNCKINGAYPKTIGLRSSGIVCKIVMVKHPSERFSWDLWSDYLADNSSGILHDFRGNGAESLATSR